LKLRTTYGLTGNDQIGSYRYLYQYNFNPAGTTVANSRWYSYAMEDYNFGLTPVSQPGLQEGALGNNNVTWEIAHKANIGFDLKALGSHLTLVGDIFQEKRDNILVVRGDVPTQAGLITTGTFAQLPAVNLGKVTNKGYEITIAYTNKIGDFGYTVGGNYTYAHNNIDFIAEVQKASADQMKINHPIGQQFGYVWTGKFYDYPDLTNPAIPKPTGTLYAGDLMFKDLNKDGKIDNNDITAIGKPLIPEKIFGINFDFTFKNFYLTTFWQGASNSSVNFGGAMRYEFSPNVYALHLGRWEYDPSHNIDTRATATYPSLHIGGSAQTTALSTFQLLNSEFIRLKSAEFGYNFPKSVVKRLKIADLRLYISGQNLLTFDHIHYIDPEYTSAGRGNTYPQTKFYAVGLYVTF
jgi:hypothetical protein